MRTITVVLVGLVAFLAVVSGSFWSQLRVERQRTSELEARLGQQQRPAAEPSVLPSQLTATDAQSTGDLDAAETAQLPTAPPPVTTTSLTFIPANPASSDSYQSSDVTARARVAVWASRLATEGRPLTAAQLQTLQAVAIKELRFETDETVKLARDSTALDPLAAAQQNDRFIDRQNDTNRRILDVIGSQLTLEQLDGLRTQFDAWYAGAKASARVELERAAARPAP